MELTFVWVGAILFLAAFTQSLTGFGVALVSMALLPSVIDIKAAIVLVALVSFVVDTGVLTRYWRSLRFKDILPLILSSTLGVPLGIWLLRYVDEKIALAALGLVLVLYALYALIGFRLPELKRAFWAYIVGFISGILGGAYNTPGPPAVIYASCRRWEPDVFKSNLQAFFLVNSIVVLVAHATAGNFSADIWQMFKFGLIPIALGLAAGASLDRWINPLLFRKIVLALLIVMGVKMLV